MASTIWRGHLTFGLVSIPVRLYRAARKATVRMHYVHAHEEQADSSPAADRTHEPESPAGSAQESRLEVPPPLASGPPEQIETVSRIKQNLVSAADAAEPVPRSEVLKGYEFEPDRYVVLSQQELRNLRPKTSTVMQILQFAKLSEIDPVYFETSYYVAPEKGGEKAYALLYAALRKTNYVALAQVAMHGREHVIVVRPGERGILAHTMYYADEVRAENEFHADLMLVAEKELELATAFVDALAEPFVAEQFKDIGREQLQALIDAKIKGQEVAADASARTPQSAAPAVDIMEALKKSLALARKPAQKETSAPATKRAQRRKA